MVNRKDLVEWIVWALDNEFDRTEQRTLLEDIVTQLPKQLLIDIYEEVYGEKPTTKDLHRCVAAP